MRTGTLAVALSLFVAACGSSEPTSLHNTNVTPTDSTGVIPIDPNAPLNTGPQTTGWVSKSLVDNGTTYNYKVWVPANYNSASKVPVLLALHGSGGKGSDNVSQTTQGVGNVIKANPNFPALVVFPQGPAGEGGTRAIFVRISQTALSQTLNEYGKRDMSRVYLTGLSYGGLATFDIAYFNPTLFAGMLTISANLCGGCIFGSGVNDAQGNVLWAAKVKTIPIWQFQGDQDSAVPVAGVRAEVAAFKAAGVPITYTEIAGGDHAIWDGIYGQQKYWDWLWAQHR
jgi:predicted peptidase